MLFCIPLLLFVVDIHYSIYFHQLDFDTKTSKRLAQEQDVTAQGFYLELIKFHRHLDTFRSQGVDGRGSWGEGILKKKRGGGKSWTKKMTASSHGIFTSPFPCEFIVSLSVSLVYPGNLRNQRIIRVWVA